MDSNNNSDIVKYIIRNTPYGHLKETIENLKSLIGNSFLEEKEVQEEITAYEESHLKHVNLNDDKIIISKFNKSVDNFYYDQTKKLKIQINPLSENIEKIVNLEDNEVVQNNFVGFITNYLDNYKNKNFKKAFFREGDEDSKLWSINIVISAHNFNYNNFWTGEWLSWWTLDKLSETSYQLKGSLNISTYYYEEGNIQFSLKQDFSDKLETSEESEKFAEEVIKLIENNENKVQMQLDEVYDNFSDQYVKPLRRKLPGT